MHPHNGKLLIVGDMAVGKTSLFLRYSTHKFPSEYIPTVFDQQSSVVQHLSGGQSCSFQLFDTAGGEEYDRLRPLSYPKTDVVLLAFNLASKDSLESICDKFFPEASKYAPGVATVLVGTQSDLLESDLKHPENICQTQRIHEIRDFCDVEFFIKTSSLTGDNVEKLFVNIAKIVAHHPRRRETFTCTLL